MTDDEIRKTVDQFILDRIDSVPHLEALLLLWNSRPKTWSREELERRLFLEPDMILRILRELGQQGLIVPEGGPQERYRYEFKSDEQDHVVAAVDATYRHELVRVSTMIHSKPSRAVREFARAFRFTKERD